MMVEKIDTKGFCLKCGEKKEINNLKLDTVAGKSIIRGNCEICGGEITTIVPQTTSQKDLEDIEKEKERMREKERFKKEEKEVQKYVGESKLPPNKEKLLEHGYNPPMKKNYYNLIKVALFLLTIITILLVYRTLYSEDFIPIYNSSLGCGDDVITFPECPTCPNQECSPSFFCEFPENLEINLVNGSG